MSGTVEIIIPVYNGAKYIAQTIQSVQEQTFQDFRIIVSDNASTDDTVAVVESIGDPRVELIRQSENIGPQRNFNALIQATRAEYVKMFCADDVLLPEALERQVEALRNTPGAVLCSCDSIMTDAGLRLGKPMRFRHGVVEREELVKECVRDLRNWVGGPSNFLARGEVLRQCAFRSEFKFLSDMIIGLDMLRHGVFVGLDEPGYLYRRHETSDTMVSCGGDVGARDWLRFMREEGLLNVRTLQRLARLSKSKETRREVLGLLRRFSMLERADAFARACVHGVARRVANVFR